MTAPMAAGRLHVAVRVALHTRMAIVAEVAVMGDDVAAVAAAALDVLAASST